MREFDLNIERVLENWTVAHALREVIANALDEHALTGTREPQIFQDAEGRWHIRDWGRGLRCEHLTQNENKEKLVHPDQVVGKFGVGLKDALATFDRHRVAVVIKSRYGDITTAKQAKHGFADIRTLHALITEPADPTFTGTEFILHGDALGERQVQEAKALFLRRPVRPQRRRTSGLGDAAADLRGQRRNIPARDPGTRLRDHAPDGRPLSGSRGPLGTKRRLDHRQAQSAPIACRLRRDHPARVVPRPQRRT